ncbi:fibronectin type III domain-containing protein [Agromyces protaetiae]|uniref:Fibronectin type III domain-containing protein n=1 Tax=Agromyces protaetiae TaxID=2509455 RepID=A0A4P6FD33_9MICO|nr:Ig-like domain-containing protein [Agromyces protaetiae]QAY73765.1 fibronectin type III domain-containing protein [Agromyces protaetiae]
MGFFSLRGPARKSVASTAVLAVLAGVPIGIAVLHEGFPVTDPDLRVRDVWVTNASDLLAGRLNRQIEELDAAVAVASATADVFQNGDDVFLYDAVAGAVERVDPSYTELIERIDVPPASKLAYGGDVLAVLSPKGELWRISTGGELSFDWRGTEPVAKLGEGGAVAVSGEGTVLATAAEKGELLELARGVDEPERVEVGSLGEHQLAAVGEQPVILDRAKNTVIVGDRRVDLPDDGLRLQQSGPDAESAIVATSNGLLEIPLGGGEVVERSADGASGSTPDRVAAPVRVGTCVHGAWADSARYLAVCDGREPHAVALDQSSGSGRFEFRVNRDVVALNNLDNGDAWLIDSDLRLVDNWGEVSPPDESDGEEGDEKASTESFEDTLAQRTEQNRPPVAHDDTYGVRAGRATIIDVLQNDSDPDGDVLTVASTTAVPESMGRLEVIDGGRALQFLPAEAAAGTTSFRYSVSDGREGVAEASVNVRLVPESENVAPVSLRSAALSIEQNQQISYNLLTDWVDPDGDDVFLVDASPTGGDSVRASPDGSITFEHKSAELGLKEVAFTVSDGTATATGTLTVDVKPAGSLNPVGTPDFARVFPGESIAIEPLANDRSPSGAPLELLGVRETPDGATVTANPDRGTITFSSAAPGEYVFLYDLAAGEKLSVGLVRVQVAERPTDDAAPIAVKDTAYLRPGEPVVVPVLSNDVSPAGLVLAVQSVDDTATQGLVSVELLTNTVVRVSAFEALDRQLQFTYTVSDGRGTSTATVTVVPVPPLVKHQPPVALDDRTVVRAGDIVTVPVLANDYHPDASPIRLLDDLDQSGAPGGLAFIDDESIRFQAPETAGVQTVSYTITDDFEQTARATVTFTVVARDGSNRAPSPLPITSRTFESSGVKVDVPLDGIDPDGDSVTLLDFTSTPALGRITSRTSRSFTYEAFAGTAGTDSFTYEVQDAFGERATGTIRIGVIPRPLTQAPPVAVDDSVQMKPGRTFGIEVLANDTDPNGYALTVTDLPEIDKGITAEIRDGKRVVVKTPKSEGAYTLSYEVSNGHGGMDSAFVQIAVSDVAVIEPPTAEDQIIEPEKVVSKEPVAVFPLHDATNPGGLVEDLAVTVEGPNAKRAEVASDGTITVTPGQERYAVAFRLTNEVDDLSAMAFVIVPPLPPELLDEPQIDPRTGKTIEPTAPPAPTAAGATPTPTPTPTVKPKTQEELDAEEKAKFPPPHLKDLDEIVVPQNGKIEWDIEDLVEVPSGQPALLLSAEATHAKNDPMVDDTTLRFQPAKDYRGLATLTFEVTDGEDADDPVGRTALLRLQIIVGDPEFNDQPPTFTPRTLTIEAGESPVEIDLRASTDHTNRDNIQKVGYQNLKGATGAIAAQLTGGSKLRVSSPLGTPTNTSTRITFDLKFNEFTVPGYVDVKVVSSTRPKPIAVNDPGAGEIEMGRSETKLIPVLDNDFNPFAQDGQPLRIIDTSIDQASVGANASAVVSGSNVSVRTGPTFTGTLSIIYRIGDATKDATREAQGRVTVVVRAAPDKANPPTASAGDGTAIVRFTAPANNNSPITGYLLTWNGGSRDLGAAEAGRDQTISGLTNGTAYQFRVVAINAKGSSPASDQSVAVTPYGAPSAVGSLSIPTPGYGPTTVTANWTAPGVTGGGAVKYQARIDSGGWNDVSGLSFSFSNIGVGSHTVYVRAVNVGSGKPGPETSRAVGVPQEPPPPPVYGQVCKREFSSGRGWLVGLNYYNVPAGNYTVHATIAGGWTGTKPVIYLSGTGSVTLQNYIWNTTGPVSVSVVGPTTVSVGTASVSDWRNLPVGTCW